MGFFNQNEDSGNLWYIERLSKKSKNGDFSNFAFNDINNLQRSKSLRIHALWQFYRYKRSITGFLGFQMFEYVGEICNQSLIKKAEAHMILPSNA
jgi:hypothetical protein